MATDKIQLNEEQQAAAGLGKGAYLVDAAAGVGKTTAVTERAIRLVQSGVDPDRILQVTFTVKAAQEMASRIFERTGRRPLWATNFHRLCTRLLRMFPEFGVPAGFTIADEDDSKRLVREILAELAPNADPKKYTFQVREQVARNRLVTIFPDMDPETFWVKRETWIAGVAEEYDLRLARENKIDFDLMLFKVALGLRLDADLRARVARLWDYIMVDEFQDTDPVQLEILKCIAPHGNVVGVGDMDQGIYRFRGAEPRNMQYFVKHFGASILPLQTNYRSRPEILELANRVIAHNPDRYPKALLPSKGPGGQIYLRQYADSHAEAEAVAREVSTLIRTGVRPEEIAVLYRVSASSRQVETAFMANGIPHRVLGALRFWDRREVKDVMAWAAVLVGLPDWDAWKRAASNPRIGVGDSGWAKARSCATPEDGLEACLGRKVFPFLMAIRKARALGSGADALGQLLESSGYLSSLQEEFEGRPEELAQRLGNVHETVAAVREFGSIQTFLDEVALGCPERDENQKKGVVLSTIHAAKGLEWDRVFILALAEDVLPHYLALKGTEDDLAEERRLFYVAITRARQGLHMSLATFLEQPGAGSKVVLPSRFLVEAGMAEKIRRCG